MNSKEYIPIPYDSVYLQCFQNKQNFILSHFVPPAITCIEYKKRDIQLLKSIQLMDTITRNQDKYPTYYYKHHPLIEIDNYSQKILNLQTIITHKCNVPVDTPYYILNYKDIKN